MIWYLCLASPARLSVSTHELFSVLVFSLHSTGSKVILFLVWQASVPLDALQFSWTEDIRKTWALRLFNASCTDDLIQVTFCCLTE